VVGHGNYKTYLLKYEEGKKEKEKKEKGGK